MRAFTGGLLCTSPVAARFASACQWSGTPVRRVVFYFSDEEMRWEGLRPQPLVSPWAGAALWLEPGSAQVRSWSFPLNSPDSPDTALFYRWRNRPREVKAGLGSYCEAGLKALLLAGWWFCPRFVNGNQYVDTENPLRVSHHCVCHVTVAFLRPGTTPGSSLC